jgi:hypothetical protein
MNKFFLLLSMAFLTAVPLHQAVALERYSHGNPTSTEQFMLELINRARANPPAEGTFLFNLTKSDADIGFAVDYFNVNLTRLKQDFNGCPVRPPLAFNPKLLVSSHRHSNDLAMHNFQAHKGTDGSQPVDRVNDAGYNFSTFGENIFSLQVPTAIYGHAGLNIDWGPGAFGVQPGVGHRVNIMSPKSPVFREIGIAVASRSGTNATDFGKLAITQDFGIQQSSPSFLVGVAYYDRNKNGICDPGEGLPNVKVLPATGTFYALTSFSGGYAIPFTSATGNTTVTFSGGGMTAPVTKNFSITSMNTKVDLRITSGSPFVYLQTKDGSGSEQSSTITGRTATFRVVRVSGSIAAPLIVSITRPITGSGVAVPADYKLGPVAPATLSKITSTTTKFMVTIPAGKLYADVNLVAIKDTVTESTETVAFKLASSSAYLTGSPSSSTLSITK